MKILCVIGQMGAGGAERVMATLVNHFTELEWDVTLHHLQANTDRPFYAINSNVNMIGLKYHDKKPRNLKDYMMLSIKAFFSLRKCIRQERPDVVLSMIDQTNCLVLMSTFFLRVPIIVREEIDVEIFSKNKPILNLLRRILYKRASKVLFLSKRIEKFSSSFFNLKKTGFIGNSVSLTNHCKPSYQSLRRIINVGRLAEQKDHKTLIKAFAIFYQKFPNYILDIYGVGKKKEILQELIRQLGLTKSVFLKGLVEDVQSEFRSSDFFVISSIFEGFGIVTIEAMSVGCPVIGTSLSTCDIPEIQNEKNALIVPVGDVEAMARAMERMATDESLRERLGKAGLEVAKNYDHDVIMKKWENLFMEVANSK